MAEEILTPDVEPIEPVDNTRILVALKKKVDDSLIAVSLEDYEGIDKRKYATLAVLMRNEDTGLNHLIAKTEQILRFGEGTEVIPETDKRRKNYTNPTMTDLDGADRTAYLLQEHEGEYGDGCALCFCRDYGVGGLEWFTPSGGEMSALRDKREEIDAVLTAIGGTPVSDGTYWTSTQYNNLHAWDLDMATGEFEFWNAKGQPMLVRPMADGSAFEEA
jgi:hypothetical protein